MLAARANQGGTSLELEDIPKPTADPGDVVVKIEVAGIAYGLLELYRLGMYPVLPRTLGHEGAGVVESVGPGVVNVAVGDRVRIQPILSCQRCDLCLTDREQYCRQASVLGHLVFLPDGIELQKRYLHGTLAEFVRVPAWGVDSIPDSMSFETAAKVHDAADALRAMKVAEARPGSTVVVTAATGVMGVSIVRLARMLGVARLILVGRSSHRLALSRQLAPSLVETLSFEDLDPSWEENGGLTAAIRDLVPNGPDAVIDFLNHGAGTWQAIASLRPNGTAAIMGGNPTPPPVPAAAMMNNGWRIIGTHSCTRLDAQQVMSWINSGLLSIEDLITHRFDLEDIAEADRIVSERREPTWMVAVYPQSGGAAAASAGRAAAAVA